MKPETAVVLNTESAAVHDLRSVTNAGNDISKETVFNGDLSHQDL